ncbi:MAG: NAD(P)-binding protein, partial [Bacteroidales bacterium]|nr:NAD(P)-binding protein [Bacteroidales bacterium]
MKKTCTVIVGGTSGLMAGALLSVSGFEVTVLEKNPSLGGGMQMFTRSGTTFETGMHVIAGHHGGLVGKLLACLGRRDEIEIIATDPEVAASVYVASDGRAYRIPDGKEAVI